MDSAKNYFGHEVKIRLVRESEPIKECFIVSAKDVYALVKDELKAADRELFLAICLNSKNKVLGINVVSIGTLNASLIHPREVFKPAILQNAVAIILAHNHPSGAAEPSIDDKNMTEKLIGAGNLLDIDVMDHVIVGNNYYSFADHGLIKTKGGENA